VKVTWFGNTAFRLHIGGKIIAIEPERASAGVDVNEMVGGADHVLALEENRPVADAASWKPRGRERLLDAGEGTRPVQFWSMGASSLLVDADEDMPLLLLAGPVPVLGRWADRTVVILVGNALAERAAEVIGRVAPRLIGLAGEEAEIEAAFVALRDRLDGTGLVALERGMAVEV